MNAIEIVRLVKDYGNFRALDDLSINVPQGKIFGFLGPNGAGKTTATRILAGLAHPTSGSVNILGHDATKDSIAIKRLIGYLPDVPAFYEWMRADEYLIFIGEIFGLRGVKLKNWVADLLEVAGLSGIKKRIGEFSRGMKQRLGMAQTFINNPDVLLLDEPTSALDPIGRKEVLDMIKSLSERKTVFFSTHILTDVERVCDLVAIIDRGRLIIQGDLEQIKEKYAKPTFVIEIDDDAGILSEKLRRTPWVSSVKVDRGSILIDVSDVKTAQVELSGIISECGLPLRKLELKESSLEEIFVGLVNAQKSNSELPIGVSLAQAKESSE